MHHLALQVYNTPLMILPQKLEVITRVQGIGENGCNSFKLVQ
jgi:hypothetical protein